MKRTLLIPFVFPLRLYPRNRWGFGMMNDGTSQHGMMHGRGMMGGNQEQVAGCDYLTRKITLLDACFCTGE